MAHILVPGPVIFQNTAAGVMFVPVVLELAGTSELSEVYAEYLLVHLLLPEINYITKNMYMDAK
jgi:hypothetical protein